MLLFLNLYLIASVIFILTGVLAISRNRKNYTNRLFLALCLVMAHWSLMFGLTLASGTHAMAVSFYKQSIVSWSLFCCLLLHMVLIQSRRYKHSFWRLALLYLPGLMSMVIYLMEPSTLVLGKFGWIYIGNRQNGLVPFVYITLFFCAYLLETIIYLFGWWKNAKGKKERKQAALILHSVLLAAIIAILTDIILPTMGVDSIPPVGIILCTLPMVIIYYVIIKYDFLSLNPQNLAVEYLGIMSEGLIVLDNDHKIADVNKSALNMLLYDEQDVKGFDIALLLPQEAIDQLGDRRYCFETQVITKRGDLAPVLLTYSVLYDNFGDAYGSVIILEDVSEIKMFQKELQIKIADLQSINNTLNMEILNRKKAEQKIEQLAYYDSLTGLPNRWSFSKKLENLGEIDDFAVLYLDLDMFKNINDTMGHLAGDLLLQEVANRLTTLVDKNSIARIGGDEFLILIERMGDTAEVESVARNIIAKLRAPFVIKDQLIHITTSIGISIYPHDGQDITTLIKNSDISLYKAKENGKNQYVICSEVLKKLANEEMILTNQLYTAIEKNELVLFYQPQINSITNEIIGFEALLRWNHPELGLLNPDRFLSLAEKTGLINEIGEWVIRTACQQNKAWQNEGLINVPIAVNLSVSQIYSESFIDKMMTILADTGMGADFLELEIVESAIMRESNKVLNFIERIKEKNIKIAIDDFGTEYSSLSYLKLLPIDRVKIARDFISEIGLNHKDESILKMIVELLNKLNYSVVAEGVETKQQLDFLNGVRCHTIQGFYYYKPMPADKVSEMLSDGGFSGVAESIYGS